MVADYGIIVEAPTAPSLEEFGAGKACGIILGVFFGMLAIAYIFFMPYFTRRLIKGDARLRWYHIPLGPMLRKDNVHLYFPGDPNGDVVIDHYESAHRAADVADSPVLRSNNEKDVGNNSPRETGVSKDPDSIDTDPEQNTLPPPAKDKRFMYVHISLISISNPSLDFLAC